MSDFTLPYYAAAADNHNIANGNVSWLNPDSWATKLGNVGRFIASSALSGTNSFYNTGLQYGRWAGLTDVQDRDTASWITSFDNNLGRYYEENKEGADLAGFVLGALVPGLGGVKIFNAGQVALKTAKADGLVGGTLSLGTKLLTTNTDEYLQAAADTINKSTTAVKLLNTNTVKAIGSGFYQNVLESAAFETAVIATMFKAPTLEDADAGDIAGNILLGGVIGGTIASAFTTAKTFGLLKRKVQEEDPLRRGFLERTAVYKATPESDRIVFAAFNSDYEGAAPIILRNPDGTVVPNNYNVSSTLFQDRITKNFNEMRASIGKLAGREEIIGQLVADISQPVVKDGRLPVNFSQGYMESFSGAIGIFRADVESALEIAARKALEAGETPKTPVGVRYLELHGENVGRVSEVRSGLPTLGDLHGNRKAVQTAVQGYKFGKELPDVSTWSAIKLTAVRGFKEAEARYIWAMNPAKGGLLKEVRPGSVVDKYDIPVLERAFDDGIYNLRISTGEGPTLAVQAIGSKQELLKILKESKEEAAAFLRESFGKSKSGKLNPEISDEAIARIVNVRQSYLAGQQSDNLIDDLFAHQSAARDFQKLREARKLSSTTPGGDENPLFLPRTAKIVYAIDNNVAATSEHILDAMALYKAKQKGYQEGADRVFARVAGPLADLFPRLTDKMMQTAFRTGSGPGLFSSENSNYGTLGSTLAFVGSITRNMKQEFRKQTSDALESALVKLGQNREAAIEFETLNQKVTRSPAQFVLREDTLGNWVLVDRAVITENVEGGGKVVADYADYELLEEGVNAFTIRNEETLEALKTHIQVAGERTGKMKDIRAQQGYTDYKDTEVYRPIRPNLRDYPHFAFVKDDAVTGAGHLTMIHAASARELEELANKVPGQYRVIFKTEVEEFKRAAGQYEFARTLNENYINADLAKEGVFSNFFTKTDPQKIVDDILQQHLRESDTLVTEAVRLKYEPQFAYLEDFGKQYSKAETSRFASRSRDIEQTADNPFFNYIKTALDISKINEQPLVYGFNKLLDDAVSKAESARRAAFSKASSPEQLEAVNATLDRYGMKPAFYDADLNSLVNHSAPRGILTKWVRQANAVLSQFVLGLDPLNALNNAIGSNILRSTELKHLYRAIQEGNTEIAGELSALAKIKLPGTGDEILAPTKLVSKAISNFWKDRATDGAPVGPLLAKYKEMGLIKDRAEQLKMLADDFTLKGTESVEELNRKMNTGFQRAKAMIAEKGGAALDAGEKYSGNLLAEEFNRFVSANVMDQLTDLAVRRGLMDEATAKTYINTFVNRVEGNIVASQRPLIFQGPIGQAISLFQSYQFNLLQQLFRYVGEGSKKDLALLAGLQSTLYGIQSLPAFQFINVHLLGQMSGNQDHKDTYDAVYGIAGKTAGDFILYGLPSNILQTNIYSRGDINPRQLTILPTTLQEIPIVNGYAKFFGSMYETVKKINGGGDVWESILQGVEHNGISRPLAGFAQTLQALDNDGVAYSTSNKGSILYQNDLMSLATLTRLAGGRPLDEAVVNDAMFRVRSYEAARRADKLSLAERIKTTLIQGNQPDEEQLNRFVQRYVELGGKQKNFNKYMLDMYTSANEPQAEKIRNTLGDPFSYKLQLLMGGDDPQDPVTP